MKVDNTIWGEESTWRRDTDGFSSNSNVPDELQFKRGQYNTIRDYVSNNRLEQGKPIDYSICYAGQAEGMPLASMRTWNLDYNANATAYKRNKETGWFFGHHVNGIDSTTYQLVCSNAIFKNDGTGLSDIKKKYWLPDGIAQNYPNQPSERIIPIVSFPTRGCYFGIRCQIFRPSTGSNQNKYLDELKTGDWSEWKIYRVYGVLYTYRANDADYTPVPTGSSHYCHVCMNEPIEFESDPDGDKAVSVLNYALLISETFPIFGWINNETSIYGIGGVYHAMQRSFNTTSQLSSTAPIFIDTVPNTTFNIVNYTSWGKGFEGYCDINSENLEAIRRAAAAYGLFFVEKNPSDSSFAGNPSRWTHADMFCGLLDSNGIGHGEYTRGVNNKSNPAYSIGSSQESKYGKKYNIRIGNASVNDIYIGDKYVKSAYLGDQNL